jgi:Leucine-rich repeat (LRR) protein
MFQLQHDPCIPTAMQVLCSQIVCVVLHFDAQVTSCSTVRSEEPYQLLQLPAPALYRALQQLDQCSLASTAVTCSSLSHAVPACISKAAVGNRRPTTRESFTSWLNSHSTSPTNLTQCSVLGSMVRSSEQTLHYLPCPKLRQLHLQNVKVQLGAMDGRPAVLHDCTGLTALGLQQCTVQDTTAGVSAATAALPRLQALDVDVDRCPPVDLQHPSQLTWLSFVSCSIKVDLVQLPQLSAFGNLQHLRLGLFSEEGVPGGFPSQLAKLKRLDARYFPGFSGDQFQHLGSFTALQELAVRYNDTSSTLPDLTGLALLTGFRLECHAMNFSTAGAPDKLRPSFFDDVFGPPSRQSWTRLTALQSLDLSLFNVQPFTLAAFTQLRALSLQDVQG